MWEEYCKIIVARHKYEYSVKYILFELRLKVDDDIKISDFE